jgi:hypothetical protein
MTIFAGRAAQKNRGRRSGRDISVNSVSVYGQMKRGRL